MLSRVLNIFRSLATPVDERQVGAIPYAMRDGAMAVLLITSRGTGSWICPKGGLMNGLSEAEAAAQEACEEAGVRGAPDAAIGSYRAVKQRDGREVRLEVKMFPLRVEEELDDWPERSERKRRWATVGEASRLLRDRGLAQLVTRLARALEQDQTTSVSNR